MKVSPLESSDPFLSLSRHGIWKSPAANSWHRQAQEPRRKARHTQKAALDTTQNFQNKKLVDKWDKLYGFRHHFLSLSLKSITGVDLNFPKALKAALEASSLQHALDRMTKSGWIAHAAYGMTLCDMPSKWQQEDSAPLGSVEPRLRPAVHRKSWEVRKLVLTNVDVCRWKFTVQSCAYTCDQGLFN